MILAEPAFYAVAVSAVLLAGISKAGFGGAVGGLSVPLLSLVVSPPVAVAIMLPILAIMDGIGLFAFRGRYDPKLLRRILPAGLVGIALGWLLFSVVDPRWVKGLIGVESILFALQRLREGRLAWEGPSRPARVLHTGGWAAVSGFTSFISHAGGPPIMQALMPLRMDRVRMVGTLTWYFAVINAAKWLPYGMLGLLDGRNLGTSAMLLPVVPVGYGIGLLFLKHVSQAVFMRIATWLLLLTGLKLCWDAWIQPIL